MILTTTLIFCFVYVLEYFANGSRYVIYFKCLSYQACEDAKNRLKDAIKDKANELLQDIIDWIRSFDPVCTGFSINIIIIILKQLENDILP